MQSIQDFSKVTWEAVARAKIDGLQHCCEHVSKTPVAITAAHYYIETHFELEGLHIEQACSFL
jgi:hypothetical protein